MDNYYLGKGSVTGEASTWGSATPGEGPEPGCGFRERHSEKAAPERFLGVKTWLQEELSEGQGERSVSRGEGTGSTVIELAVVRVSICQQFSHLPQLPNGDTRSTYLTGWSWGLHDKPLLNYLPLL